MDEPEHLADLRIAQPSQPAALTLRRLRAIGSKGALWHLFNGFGHFWQGFARRGDDRIAA